MALRSVLLGGTGVGTLLLLGLASGAAHEDQKPAARAILTLREAVERAVWRDPDHRSDTYDVDAFLAREAGSRQALTADPLIKPFFASSIVSSPLGSTSRGHGPVGDHR